MTTAHVYTTYIRAELGDVWNALIDPAFTRQYFFGSAFDTPPVAGTEYRSVMPDGSVAVTGRIEELDPPHRLVQTWTSDTTRSWRPSPRAASRGRSSRRARASSCCVWCTATWRSAPSPGRT